MDERLIELKCPRCPKEFQSPKKLKRHLYHIHGLEPSNPIYELIAKGLDSED